MNKEISALRCRYSVTTFTYSIKSMDYNKKILLSVIAGASLILPGCSHDNDVNPPVENLTVVEEGSVKPAQKAESTQPTAILGSGGSMSGLLTQTFTNIVEPNKAKHVIVACADMDAYKDEILAAYQRGIIITIVDPDAEKVDEWCNTHGLVYPGNPTSEDNNCMISFNRKAVSMSVQKKKDKGELIEEDEVPLVIFTSWLESILTPNLKGPDFRSKDIRKRFSPQHVSHVFPIDLPLDILERNNWPLPDKVSLSTTAELKCDIYPLHSFADNTSFTGDIYAVEAELTIHNGNLYNGRWQYNRMAGLFEVCGFYLSDLGFGASLLEKTYHGLEKSSGYQVIGGPAPASTPASEACQSGFEWNFDGWLTGGNGLESATPTPLQQGGWTWNNLTENSTTGIKIDQDRNTAWTLHVANLPYDRNSPVPELATGDLTFRCSWIWGVPQAVDGSADRFYMNVNIDPVYYWHWSSLPDTKIETDYIMPPYDTTSFTFMLIPPSRAEGQRI